MIKSKPIVICIGTALVLNAYAMQPDNKKQITGGNMAIQSKDHQPITGFSQLQNDVQKDISSSKVKTNPAIGWTSVSGTLPWGDQKSKPQQLIAMSSGDIKAQLAQAKKSFKDILEDFHSKNMDFNFARYVAHAIGEITYQKKQNTFFTRESLCKCNTQHADEILLTITEEQTKFTDTSYEKLILIAAQIHYNDNAYFLVNKSKEAMKTIEILKAFTKRNTSILQNLDAQINGAYGVNEKDTLNHSLIYMFQNLLK